METVAPRLVELEGTMLGAVADWSAAVRPDGLTGVEAARVMKAAVKARNMASAVELLVTQRAADAPAFRDRTGRPDPDAMAKAKGGSTKAARRSLSDSKTANATPELADAMRSGELSPQQSEQIADAAKSNPGAVTDLIDKARSEDAKGLRDACERAKAGGDPDPETTRRRIHSQRKMIHWNGPDGSRRGFWQMTPEDAAEIEHVLDLFTEIEFNQARAEGRREPYEAYRADAMLAMARAAMAGGGDGPVKVPKEVILRVDWDAFTRGHAHDGETVEIRDLGPVPVSVAREWASDAFLKAIIFDSTGVRYVKHLGRHLTAEMRTAVMDRDQTCTDPGCNRSRGLEHDHVVPWAQHPETTVDGSALRCKPGHRAKTIGDNQETRRLKTEGRNDQNPTDPDQGRAPSRRSGCEPPSGDPEPPTLFDRSVKATQRSSPRVKPEDHDWRNRIRRGLPPPEVGPFDDEGLDL